MEKKSKNKKFLAQERLYVLLALLLVFVVIVIVAAIQLEREWREQAVVAAEGIFGEFDGVVVSKDGGLYEIQDLNYSDMLHKIRNGAHADESAFPVGSHVRFSYVENDKDEYKYSNSMSYLSDLDPN